MQEKLVEYLLGALEVEEVSLVQQALQWDVEVSRQLDILRLGLAPLEGDRDHVEPPPGLAMRTCERIRAVQISKRS